jgi:formamidopyrimidine-DNA glycosylase
VPELPEVESVRRQLAPELLRRRVREVEFEPQRRFLALDRLAGRTVQVVGRRGKYLLCSLDGDTELIIHLGMTGSLRFDVTDAHTRARMHLDDGRVLAFRDPRRFGRIAVVDAGDHTAIPTLALLGPEPLSDAFTVEGFARALAETRAPVKALLLAQRAVAGVGNIYADESLWRARIHPASRRVGTERAARLHACVRDVLAEAVAREGTTFRDYRMVNGEGGRNAPYLDAYGKAGAPCRRCDTTMRRTLISGRGTSYCPVCQRI